VVRLKRIRLRRLPGIDPEFTLENLGEGVNVIVGPNGSGKTSLCKAMVAMLWPGRNSSKKLELESLWQDGERALSAERDGAQVRWQCNGEPVEPPQLPAESLSACYTMGMRDLIVGGDDTDADIARKIRVQMSGGYELDKVRREHFLLEAKLGRRERDERDRAQEQLRAVQKEFRDLASEEGRLDELSSALKLAKLAQTQVGWLERAVDLAVAEDARATCQSELEHFPVEMSALRGDDRVSLAQLEGRRDSAATEVAESAEALGQAEAGMRASGLDETRPDEAELEACLSRVSVAEALARDVAVARERSEVARAKLEAARESLGFSSATSPVSKPFAQLSLELLGRAEALLARADKLRAQYAGVKTQIDLLTAADGGEETCELTSLSRASDSLRNWLASPAALAPAVPTWQIAVATTVAVLASGLAVYDDLAWLFVAGAAVAMVAGGLVLRGRRSGGDGDMRHQWAREFELSRVAEPPHWHSDSVRALLHLLDERCARAKVGELRRTQLLLLRQRLSDLDAEQAELLAARCKLREELGLDVDCGIDSDLALSVLARRWHECDAAASEAAAAEAKVELLSAEFSEVRAGLLHFLNEYGLSCEDDLAAVRARLSDLRRRLSDYGNYRGQRESAVRRLDRANADHSAALAQIEEFYAERGLGVDDKHGLEERLRQLDSYRDARRHCEHQTQLVEDNRARLVDHTELLDLSLDDARARLEQAAGEAESLDRISGEIGSIRARLDEAAGKTELESAQARLTAAKDALAEVCEKARVRAAGCFLLDEVDREHERESRPAVLDRAVEYFAAFTHNSYELKLSDAEGAQFRALDTSSGQGLAISELSEGTRIQLLLAVRVAFAISAERGCRLPLVFDEVLSTADPQRFDAVAESLCVLAGEGRQVFYMTSNPSDAERWKAVCRAAGETELRLIDLGKIRGQQQAIDDLATIHIPKLPELPRPDGLSPEDYAIALHGASGGSLGQLYPTASVLRVA